MAIQECAGALVTNRGAARRIRAPAKSIECQPRATKNAVGVGRRNVEQDGAVGPLPHEAYAPLHEQLPDAYLFASRAWL